MNKRLKHQGIVRDDRAVALTEFCIVMPVVLFLFLAILQYFENVRAAQMVNYAAYVAARSYAVLHDQDKAKTSAVMVLAPISNNTSLPGNSSLGGALSGLDSFFGQLAGAIPGGQSAAVYAKGLVSAEGSLLLGSFSVSSNQISGTSLAQVSVAIDYPQFINIPGFAGFWKMFSQNELLPPSLGYDYQNYLWSKGLGAYAAAAALAVAEGCVDIPGRCATGYESWGSEDDYNKDLKTVNDLNTVHTGWWDSSSKWKPRMAKQPD